MFRRLALAALLVLSLTTVVAPQAGAELTSPRQQWLRESANGLFLHWGERTAPAHTDCAAWEKDVTDGGWTAQYWIDEALKLHAQYVVLASFHSRLGYARAWPSQIPGSCSTKRDFLGELIRAGDARGVKVILYMTDDPQWYWEGLPAGSSWFDSAAYSAYKGKSVDLSTRPGFGEFSYDNFVEVMHNYPGLAGFWIDNDNAYWEQNGLYERIRQERPSWTLSNNNEDTPIMDMVSHEQKVGMTPAYDYPQAVLTPQPRMTEGEWKLPTKGAWWFDGSDSDVDYPVTMGRMIANAGSSVRSLMAETAMVNGRFPAKQEAFNNFAASYLPQIWDTIHGVEGGGYLYGGLTPGFWNDGAHGVITMKTPDLQYVHVLTKPATASQIVLRDNGYRVRAVHDYRTGESKPFSQANGYLTINGITQWDTYDTVFQVDTEGQVPAYQATATATASANGHAADGLSDQDYLTYWDSNKTLPVSVTLDLGAAKNVKYLAANQREWSPTYNRNSFGRPEDSARIKDYSVEVSTDGTTWTTAKTGVMPSARAVQYVDLPADTMARYVRLNVATTWAAANAPNYYQRLRIDELWTGGEYATPATSTGITVDRAIPVGDLKLLPVFSRTSGDHVLSVIGAADGTKSFSVSVNGEAPRTVKMTGWSSSAPRIARSIPAHLHAGLNIVTVQATGTLDEIVVR
ncbi:discoidin domain-containing protein [Actinocrispum sp. NPDC049592]|uniref:discoidin domain-containing protein n=1 Tax=Actinocrispum sp. NPDC049592 TaxID=3154835 RepID=UPI00341F96FB